MTESRKENHLTENKEPLKPCPFCGSRMAAYYSVYDCFLCAICGTRGPIIDKNGNRWNMRELSRRAPHPDGLREVLKGLIAEAEQDRQFAIKNGYDKALDASSGHKARLEKALSATPQAATGLSESEKGRIATIKGYQEHKHIMERKREEEEELKKQSLFLTENRDEALNREVEDALAGIKRGDFTDFAKRVGIVEAAYRSLLAERVKMEAVVEAAKEIRYAGVLQHTNECDEKDRNSCSCGVDAMFAALAFHSKTEGKNLWCGRNPCSWEEVCPKCRADYAAPPKTAEEK